MLYINSIFQKGIIGGDSDNLVTRVWSKVEPEERPSLAARRDVGCDGSSHHEINRRLDIDCSNKCRHVELRCEGWGWLKKQSLSLSSRVKYSCDIYTLVNFEIMKKRLSWRTMACAQHALAISFFVHGWLVLCHQAKQVWSCLMCEHTTSARL